MEFTLINDCEKSAESKILLLHFTFYIQKYKGFSFNFSFKIFVLYLLWVMIHKTMTRSQSTVKVSATVNQQEQHFIAKWLMIFEPVYGFSILCCFTERWVFKISAACCNWKHLLIHTVSVMISWEERGSVLLHRDEMRTILQKIKCFNLSVRGEQWIADSLINPS